MLGVNHVIIMSLIATINVANAEDSDIVYPADFKYEDISSLKPLTSRQALPLILFESDKTNSPIEFPTDLAQAEINDGRLASGTEFYTSQFLKEKQIYFCPASTVGYNNCLAPKEFGISQVLECEVEPSPLIILKRNLTKCGPKGIGTPLVMIYRLCKAEEPYSYNTTNVVIYSFCYHKSSKKVLFVSYPIIMTKFLTENLLAREREIKYQRLSSNANSAINEDFQEILDEAAASYPQYEFQKMANPDLFAFALWRKSAHHYVNVALQHKELVGLWNQIHNYIRTNIIEMHILPPVIRSGVIDIPADQISTNDENTQMYNIWCSIVADLNREPKKGIAILMNNFFTKNEKLGNFIDGLCEEEDYCVKSLKDESDQVGVRVRCCRVTEKVSKFFRLGGNIISIDEILRIRNITYTPRRRTPLGKIINLMDN